VFGTRLGLVTTAIGMATLLAACGSSPDGAGGPSSRAAAASTPPPTGRCALHPVPLPDGAVSIPVPAATVVVTDPGTEPRTAVSIHPAGVQRIRLFTNSLQVSQLAGDPASGGNRDVTVPLTAQPSCSDPLQVRLFFGAPTSTDDTTTAALSTVAGTVGGLQLRADGQVTALTLAAPPGIDAGAQSVFEQALLQTFSRLLVLPPTPIGAGARWTVTRTLRSETTLTQTMHVGLATVAAEPALKADVDESPNDDVFHIPGSSQTLTINTFTSAGGADVTLDPALALPVGGALQLQGGRSLTGGAGSKTLVQRTGFTYRFEN
jgi:hypothetical protein